MKSKSNGKNGKSPLLQPDLKNGKFKLHKTPSIANLGSSYNTK